MSQALRRVCFLILLLAGVGELIAEGSSRLEPGQSMRVKLDVDPATGDPRVEVIHP